MQTHPSLTNSAKKKATKVLDKTNRPKKRNKSEPITARSRMSSESHSTKALQRHQNCKQKGRRIKPQTTAQKKSKTNLGSTKKFLSPRNDVNAKNTPKKEKPDGLTRAEGTTRRSPRKKSSPQRYTEDVDRKKNN